jgi:hypothetical protein
MSYIRRRIDVTVTLGKGDFGVAGQNTVTLKGLRVSANIQKAGDPGFDTASVRLWGLTASQMNTITTLGKPLQFFRDNTITLEAGDENGVAVVFTGTIQSAYQDFSAAPDASINIVAFTGLLDANAPIKPTSFPGAADVAVIMSGLAQQMVPKRSFENSGVRVTLASPYFPGTARAQIEACAKAANIYWHDDGQVLAIWPKDGKRGGLVPVISPESGLVGYPQYTSAGVAVKALYMPGIIYGGEIQLKSSITPANGSYLVNRITYELESEMPDGGAWFMELEGYRPENVAS